MQIRGNVRPAVTLYVVVRLHQLLLPLEKTERFRSFKTRSATVRITSRAAISARTQDDSTEVVIAKDF